MIGTICGDVIGSRFERSGKKSLKFKLFTKQNRFTDDTVMSFAVLEAILTQKDYGDMYRKYYNIYPNRGYGRRFISWAKEEIEDTNSWGNGAAMRVAPIGWLCDNLTDLMEEAKESAIPTHNSPEAIRSAQAVASCVFFARRGMNKSEIKNYIEYSFGYDLSQDLDVVRKKYEFDVSAEGSVPQAIMCFLQSLNFENAVRNAVSLGGDADTQAAIAGAIAEAYYGEIPYKIVYNSYRTLDDNLRNKLYGVKKYLKKYEVIK